MSKKLNVLFLCTGNSCRSQMAEGLTRHLKGDVINAFSAGIETHGLNPNAIKVMAEIGIDISGQKSQNISEFDEAKIDHMITVCGHAHETCPIVPNECLVKHVGFPDPPKLASLLEKQGASEESQLDCYRNVRDEIKAFVESLPGFLDPDPAN